MKTQPIKRSDELKILSREHHLGLLFCWKIKEGLKLQAETSRLNGYLNYFWNAHLKDHFLSEEGLLFDRIDDPVCEQAKADHLAITTQIEKINSTEAGTEAYIMLTEMLTNHIRFEERVAFPALEEHLAASPLPGLERLLEKDHQEKFKDEYPDEFWVKPKGTA